MAASKLVEANKKIEEGVVNGYKKIEEGVVGGYKKIEEGVVSGYKKMEEGAVEGFNKISDKFVDKFFTKEGETVEEAKERMAAEVKMREEQQKAREAESIMRTEAVRDAGKVAELEEQEQGGMQDE